MATSYADSAQAREWDRKMDEWGQPKPSPTQGPFHDYEAAALKRSAAQAAKSERELAERKALAMRINAAVDQMAVFWNLKERPE
ncbi:hypothetical protein [Pseudomonas lundensis]|uniref:hypothetical protein n=1 Tax=Pseudomonas lundensis TaxID=86185 RepID=UPI0014742DA2|nr:hypothetical protein [Pseudomonas lundensis]NNA02859.1 hypothetical protein [Pseudomonas lundensis]